MNVLRSVQCTDAGDEGGAGRSKAVAGPVGVRYAAELRGTDDRLLESRPANTTSFQTGF